MFYQIKVRDVRTHLVEIEVEGEDPELALHKAKGGLGHPIDFVRSETYAEIISSSNHQRERELRELKKPTD